MVRAGTVASLLAAALAGAGAGYWAGAARDGDSTIAAGDTGAVATVPTRALDTGRPAAAGLQQDAGVDNLEAERRRALSDPAYLRELLQRYAAAREPDARGALLAVLSGVATADVLHTARGWLRSDDPRQREDALDLLRAFPLSEPGARDAMVGELAAETDPARLAQLVTMLTPSLMPSEDAAPVVDRLQVLASHPDPAVRSQSVLQLAQWDTGGDGTEPLLHRALLDADGAVRRAAMAGVASTRVRSPRIKDALLDIAIDPAGGIEDRGAALFALQSFALDRADHALVARASTEVDQDQGH